MRTPNHCLPLNDCALEALIRGLPDRMSAMVESRYPNMLEIALKYALDYEITPIAQYLP